MVATILCIGTELTRGEILNTNGPWLAEALTTLGVQVAELNVVDDAPARIEQAITRLTKTSDLLICTGGLGPTTDDLTTVSVAKCLNVPLKRDTKALAAVGERLANFGVGMTPANAKQADFPEGASILPNASGTAPGFAVNLHQAQAFFLPGVPREMKGIFETSIRPNLEASATAEHHQQYLQIFGIPESTLGEKLEGIEEAYGVTLGYRAHFPTIELKILAWGQDAMQQSKTARKDAERRLGTHIFGVGRVTMAQQVSQALAASQQTLATAESCTGGTIAQLLVNQPGASRWFQGGIVAYSNQVKHDLLGVPEQLLNRYGAVSTEVACAMAEGARTHFRADLAIATTGIAGPGGGSPEKPVGLVHYALATAQGIHAKELSFPGTRQQIQLLASYKVLSMIQNALTPTSLLAEDVPAQTPTRLGRR